MALANTNDIDGRAVKTDGHISVHGDADQVEDLGDWSSRTSLITSVGHCIGMELFG